MAPAKRRLGRFLCLLKSLGLREAQGERRKGRRGRERDIGEREGGEVGEKEEKGIKRDGRKIQRISFSLSESLVLREMQGERERVKGEREKEERETEKEGKRRRK